jgi:hypothetical protein
MTYVVMVFGRVGIRSKQRVSEGGLMMRVSTQKAAAFICDGFVLISPILIETCSHTMNVW